MRKINVFEDGQGSPIWENELCATNKSSSSNASCQNDLSYAQIIFISFAQGWEYEYPAKNRKYEWSSSLAVRVTTISGR